MAGEGAHDRAFGELVAVLQDPCDAGRRCRLAEHTLSGCKESVRGQDLVVGDGFDPAPGLVTGSNGLVPRRRIPDADRRCDRFRLVDDLPIDDRRRPSSLEAPHPRSLVDRGVAPPVGSDIAGVAHGQGVDGGRRSHRVDDLPRCGLLAGDAIGIDRIDEHDVVAAGQFENDPKGIIEASVDRDDRGAVDDRLCQLAPGDLPGRDDDDRRDAGSLGICRSRGRRVAGRGTSDGPRPVLDSLRHCEGHPSVFEGPGRIQAFELEVDLPLDGLGKCRRRDEGRVAFEERHDRSVGSDRQTIAVRLDDPRMAHASSLSTRITEATLRTASIPWR